MLLQVFRRQFYKGLHGFRCYLNVALLCLTPLFKSCHVLTFCIGRHLFGQICFIVSKCWFLRKKV